MTKGRRINSIPKAYHMIDFLITTAAAQSALPAKDPFAYPFAVYGWVLLWSMAGGLVSFWNKLKTGAVRAFNVVEFIGEMVTSAFVGVLTFWICEYFSAPKLVSAVAISISGHMGTRAIFLLEQYAQKWFESKTGVKADEPK